MGTFLGHRNIYKLDRSTDDSWYTYVCGHCNTKVSGAVIAYYHIADNPKVRWLLCPNCAKGSVSIEEDLFPGVSFGPSIQSLPSGVYEAYEEARRCLSVNAFTACELICRKILMHVAVEKGAKEGESFASYLTFLESQGFVTPPMKKWVDLIRQNGNYSTHKLDSPDKQRADSTLMFTAELLRLIYEMEYIANIYMAKP